MCPIIEKSIPAELCKEPFFEARGLRNLLLAEKLTKTMMIPKIGQ
jgi:hypothetical protein